VSKHTIPTPAQGAPSPFDNLIGELRAWPVPAVIEALIAARELSELADIAADLNELVTFFTKKTALAVTYAITQMAAADQTMPSSAHSW
jgi:hypothetical protein